jgi:hypothetical protein
MPGILPPRVGPAGRVRVRDAEVADLSDLSDLAHDEACDEDHDEADEPPGATSGFIVIFTVVFTSRDVSGS